MYYKRPEKINFRKDYSNYLKSQMNDTINHELMFGVTSFINNTANIQAYINYINNCTNESYISADTIIHEILRCLEAILEKCGFSNISLIEILEEYANDIGDNTIALMDTIGMHEKEEMFFDDEEF